MFTTEEDILNAEAGPELDVAMTLRYPEAVSPDAEPSTNNGDALLLLESIPGEKRIHIFPENDWRAQGGKPYTVIVGGRYSYGASGEFFGVEGRGETLALAICKAILLRETLR